MFQILFRTVFLCQFRLYFEYIFYSIPEWYSFENLSTRRNDFHKKWHNYFLRKQRISKHPFRFPFCSLMCIFCWLLISQFLILMFTLYRNNIVLLTRATCQVKFFDTGRVSQLHNFVGLIEYEILLLWSRYTVIEKEYWILNFDKFASIYPGYQYCID